MAFFRRICAAYHKVSFMEIRVLRYFLTMAREETVLGAANALHLSQPTLSRQLKDLEEELGKKLFIRGNRRITLTDDGMLLRKRAEEILSLVKKTEAELSSEEGSVSGDIQIGGGETHTMRVVADVIRELQREYPQIHYHLFSGNADDVTERLDKGLLDFGILIEPANIQKYESIRLPGKDVWGVLMRKDSSLAAQDTISPEDLRHEPLIISRQSMTKNSLQDWLQKKLEELNITATYNLLFNASLLVESGAGYALCLDRLINTTGSNLCFRPLRPRMEAGMDIVWKKYQIHSKAQELFLNHLRQLKGT